MDIFEKGDEVMVMNNDSQGNLIQEGTAIIVKKTDYSDVLYLVRFPDGYKCLRRLDIPGTILIHEEEG